MTGATTGTTVPTQGSVIGAEDVIGVRSRISWGAIIAGSVLALALYFLLSLLGGAIGFSVSDKFGGRTIGITAAVYAILATSVCLFVGGYVASQLTTGENKREAAMFGLLVWATVFAMLLWLMASGVRMGFNTMVAVAAAGTSTDSVAGQSASEGDFDEAARRAGYTQQQVNDFKERVRNAPADARVAAEDPVSRAKLEQDARNATETAARVTWWTFFGTFISMIAAGAGGVAGAGPTLRLFAVPSGRLVLRRPVAVQA
ncbi:hypothetical protein [Zavarzinella formosa]|uniref:hypothetical protein n=1 Tax=Zavarzinella formosa TaxID=360055 RepID=UPI00030FB123|nr:hypothetical protein [Zavarzinella formosa]